MCMNTTCHKSLRQGDPPHLFITVALVKGLMSDKLYLLQSLIGKEAGSHFPKKKKRKEKEEVDYCGSVGSHQI